MIKVKASELLPRHNHIELRGSFVIRGRVESGPSGANFEAKILQLIDGYYG